MIHARLGIAAENSGKLVSIVRNEAKRAAARNGNGVILVDGPPGIGCPVIAAMTGAAGVLVVTEPTVSGAHDMERVLELAAHFQIPAAVCVNRWDLYPEGAERIEAHARDHGAIIVGRIRYDAAVTRAQVEGRTVVELGGAAADDIRAVWDHVRRWLAV
jgi:MinD superfamily P-loop ATPase